MHGRQIYEKLRTIKPMDKMLHGRQINHFLVLTDKF